MQDDIIIIKILKNGVKSKFIINLERFKTHNPTKTHYRFALFAT